MIVRWEQGRAVIDVLLKQGRLTRVAPNRALAASMLIQARAHLSVSAVVMNLDPQGAFTLTYDAARKALAAILVNQGLRAGARAPTQRYSKPSSRSWIPPRQRLPGVLVDASVA